MNSAEMIEQMRRDWESFAVVAASVQASVEAEAVGYRSVLAQVVKDSAAYRAAVAKVEDDILAAAVRTYEPFLDVIAAAQKHQRALLWADEAFRPLMVRRLHSDDSWLDELIGDDEPEDDRPYPGQYL